MPTYVYKCPKCSHGFEVTRPMSQATADTECPACEAAVTAEGRDFSAEGGGISGYVSPFENMYPYVSKRLAGLPAAKDLKHVPVTRKGITMMAPLIESKAQERSLMAKHGLTRE
jgi:putative FmdB family regulatory protein